MAFVLVRRVCLLHVLVLSQFICGQNSGYKIPNVRIQALRPKGFRASVEDDPKITLFEFDGNVNHEIGPNDFGAIHGKVRSTTNGRWIVEDPDVALKVGDVIKYHVFFAVEGWAFVADNLTYIITELEEPSVSISSMNVPTVLEPSPENCRPTLTTVFGRKACGGTTLFEDNFDNLREDEWRIEQYNPISHPENPFMTYQRPAVSTSEGYLIIRPQLQQSQPNFTSEAIYNGHLNLFSGCTAPEEACRVSASRYNILPPVMSGRITSKAFAFTYGTVHVRAKLPQGDWLYPEIVLTPFLMKYGSQLYTSGVIKIATARGNKELERGFRDYSNSVLYGGAIMDYICKEMFLKNKVLTGGNQWGDDFHVYSLRWAPDRITLSVDGEEWARIEPSASGLVGKFPDSCTDLPRPLLAYGTKMAPFDDFFQLSFGVAAGGTTEFPQTPTMPWVNTSPEAQLKFWEDMNTWIQTWVQAELRIDYVKVVAL